MNKGAITAAIIGGLVTLGVGTIAFARGGIRSMVTGTKPRQPTNAFTTTPAPTPAQPAPRPAPAAPDDAQPDQRASAGRTQGALVEVRNSTIYGPTGSVRITDQDALWLGRAITGEVRASRPQVARAAVAWALAQNLMLVGSRPPRFRTFSGMVLAYCQPVKAAWADPNSSLCRANPSSCPPDRIARRRGFRALSWNQLAPNVRQIVEDFRAGRVTNPVPGMVDWHASRYPEAQQQIGGNWFGTKSFRRIIRA